jgi:formylglycine-generating enzyme required for sulfatase activity
MGSPPEPQGRWSAESPQHLVTVPGVALGLYEVTFDQWQACVDDGGCTHRPQDQGWGRGNRPVINVNWSDAQAYVRWLSRRTGRTYRLPSEAEWEYAARAGSQTRFFWGNDLSRACEFANSYDRSGERLHGMRRTPLACDDQFGATAPVGSYSTNVFGLHDMAGNVWEWVEDCWHDSYVSAPTDGLARPQGACDRRIARGGSWNFMPDFLRPTFRLRLEPDDQTHAVGFRVARTIGP